MLTETKLLKNGDHFLEKSEEYKIFNDSFINEYAPRIITAPFNLSNHGAYKGGLVESILNITKDVININKALNFRFDNNYLVKLAFRFSIGKSLIFEEETEEWKINKGQLYKYSNIGVPYTFSELSLQMLNKHLIPLSLNEFSDILSFSKSHEKSVEIFASNEFNLINFAQKLNNK